ncbi:MAG TPA: PhzF family phenazine biosynthesis protein [Pirellulaceae bacterium]|nr:PhzF family phenazine biosynthesis protein [Pirellulaceae bacterium]HMO93723.1 PhzF family phenazine biosynthesis protein [Pirellulaceae bacterium]HMP69774.1 PhzF family phenazine biosynthesis protein [Pirellulaceae bacterium]
MSMHPIFQVDSFTQEPFAGNPAAVCLLATMADEGWMQNVAAEMNLSETAFVAPMNDGRFHLRWFTPEAEVDLCGHATLAAAHVLFETKGTSQPLVFSTLSGELIARLHGSEIELDFPRIDSMLGEPDTLIVEALGVPVTTFATTRLDYLVQTDLAETVRECNPDFAQLKNLGVRGVILTAQSDRPQYDFISRFFAPGVGINEDPVTGSAHCALIPFWTPRLQKSELIGFQASKRGGIVRGHLQDRRVHLYGNAVTVLSGKLSC